jgi:sucrose-6-phosphate hydrolase SacC (GH32 family)
MHFTSFILPVLLALKTAAHGAVTQYVIDGKTYSGSVVEKRNHLSNYFDKGVFSTGIKDFLQRNPNPQSNDNGDRTTQ